MMNLRATVIIAFLAALLSACEQKVSTPLPTENIIELSGQFTGDFALTDKNNKPVTDEDFEGKIMLVYFGFTNCPDVCPGDVGVMSAAMNELGNDADKVVPVFISVDPERDTTEALATYFGFDERIVALTGSVEEAADARQAFKMIAQKQPLPESALEYTVNHQRFFYILDRTGQPQLAIIGGISPQELAVVLRRSIKAF